MQKKTKKSGNHVEDAGPNEMNGNMGEKRSQTSTDLKKEGCEGRLVWRIQIKKVGAALQNEKRIRGGDQAKRKEGRVIKKNP